MLPITCNLSTQQTQVEEWPSATMALLDQGCRNLWETSTGVNRSTLRRVQHPKFKALRMEENPVDVIVMMSLHRNKADNIFQHHPTSRAGFFRTEFVGCVDLRWLVLTRVGSCWLVLNPWPLDPWPMDSQLLENSLLILLMWELVDSRGSWKNWNHQDRNQETNPSIRRSCQSG